MGNGLGGRAGKAQMASLNDEWINSFVFWHWIYSGLIHIHMIQAALVTLILILYSCVHVAPLQLLFVSSGSLSAMEFFHTRGIESEYIGIMR